MSYCAQDEASGKNKEKKSSKVLLRGSPETTVGVANEEKSCTV